MARHTNEDRVIRVLDYIHDNPSGDLSLDALADVAAMSRFHWHRVFRGMTGETCAEAVRRIRLHRAAGWVLDTDDSFAAIAARCGYDNARSFSRIFAQAYGMTPLSYRQRGEMRAQMNDFQHGDIPMHDVTIQDLPARRLACIAHRGNYQNIGSAFETLGTIMTARELWRPESVMVGVYYDDPRSVPEDQLRSHAAVTVGSDFVMDPPMEAVDLAGGPHAVLRFKGPYAELPGAYDYLYGPWLSGSDRTPGDGATFEVYLNSPMDTAPTDLITDICMPLRSV